jgi:hypothetical protein
MAVKARRKVWIGTPSAARWLRRAPPTAAPAAGAPAPAAQAGAPEGSSEAAGSGGRAGRRKALEETREYVVETLLDIAERELPCPLSRFVEEFRRETGFGYEFDQYGVLERVELGEWALEIQREPLDLIHARTADGEPVTVAVVPRKRILLRNRKTGEAILVHFDVGESWTVSDEDLRWDD